MSNSINPEQSYTLNEASTLLNIYRRKLSRKAKSTQVPKVNGVYTVSGYWLIQHFSNSHTTTQNNPSTLEQHKSIITIDDQLEVLRSPRLDSNQDIIINELRQDLDNSVQEVDRLSKAVQHLLNAYKLMEERRDLEKHV